MTDIFNEIQRYISFKKSESGCKCMEELFSYSPKGTCLSIKVSKYVLLLNQGTKDYVSACRLNHWRWLFLKWQLSGLLQKTASLVRMLPVERTKTLKKRKRKSSWLPPSTECGQRKTQEHVSFQKNLISKQFYFRKIRKTGETKWNYHSYAACFHLFMKERHSKMILLDTELLTTI